MVVESTAPRGTPRVMAYDADEVVHRRVAGEAWSRCQVPWSELDAVRTVHRNASLCTVCWPEWASDPEIGKYDRSGPWPGQIRLWRVV